MHLNMMLRTDERFLFEVHSLSLTARADGYVGSCGLCSRHSARQGREGQGIESVMDNPLVVFFNSAGLFQCWPHGRKFLITGTAGRWEARIGLPGNKHVYLGQFNDEAQAARAYDAALVRLRGNAAFTNFALSEYSSDLAAHQHVRQVYPFFQLMLLSVCQYVNSASSRCGLHVILSGSSQFTALKHRVSDRTLLHDYIISWNSTMVSVMQLT
jgi:hypothetical protein